MIDRPIEYSATLFEKKKKKKKKKKKYIQPYNFIT